MPRATVTDSAPEFTPAATVAALGKFLADDDLSAAWWLMGTVPADEITNVVRVSVRYLTAAVQAVHRAAANAAAADPDSPQTAMRIVHLTTTLHALARMFDGDPEPAAAVWERALDMTRQVREFPRGNPAGPPPDPPPAA